jgi:hypothetical protein
MNSNWSAPAARISVRVALLAAFALLALPLAVAETLTTINFDDIPGSSIRDISANRYHSQGVLLSSSGGLYAYSTGDDTDTPPSWIYGSTDGGSTANGTVAVNFVVPNTTTPRPVSFVSIYVYDGVGDATSSYSVAIFDVSNNQLGFISQIPDRITHSFTRIQSDIARLVLTPSSDLEGLDTLRFTAVPEPAAGALLATGLVMLIGRRNRA